MTYAAAALLGYVIGAAPIIYFVARARGIDLRAVGTGNIGAGNVWRHGGMAVGALSIVIEVGKGTVAALLARELLPSETPDWTAVAGGIGAVMGQMWPATLRFQGGRGNGTAAGALLAFHPLMFAVGFAVFLFMTFRNIIRNVRPGGASSPRSRAVPIAVITGMSIYVVLGIAIVEYIPASAGALVLALTFLRRATAPWPTDPETGLPPERRSLLAALLYDRPNFNG